MPKFRGGGTDSVVAYLGKNTRYPTEAATQGIQGKVFVSFVVNAAGAVEQVKVVKGVHPLLDAEALRVVQTMPAWEPGKQGRRPVSVMQTVPVFFRIAPAQPMVAGPRPKTENYPPRPLEGQEALEAYIKTNVTYPEIARRAQASAVAFVKVEVDSLGQVTDTKLMTEMSQKEPPGADRKVLRQAQQEMMTAAVTALRTNVRWQPGQSKGQPRKGSALVPVYFDGKTGQVGLLPHLRLFPTEPPTATGGLEALSKFIGQNIRYPSAALRAREQGVVMVWFEVSEDGRVENPVVVQSVSPALDSESVRVVAQLPPLYPALEQGKPVRSFFVVPVTYKLFGNPRR